MGERPPEFRIGMVSVTRAGRFEVEVTRDGSGLIRRFRGDGPNEARARANAYINGELARFYKLLAARYARARGRTLQAISASPEATEAVEE